MTIDSQNRQTDPEGPARPTGSVTIPGDGLNVATTGQEVTHERITAFIDGFNVYEGLKAKGWSGVMWLDYRRLVEQFVRTDQVLQEVVYFTAERRNPPESYVRQRVYLAAIEAVGGVRVVDGSFGSIKAPCVHCGRITTVPKEKQTDVNLASEMVLGAATNVYDTAVLLTGDNDFLGAVAAVQQAGKRVKVLRPAGRRSEALLQQADYVRDIRKNHLARAQMPDPVVRDDGTAITCPFEWLTVVAKVDRLNPAHGAYLRSLIDASDLNQGHDELLHPIADALWRDEKPS